MRLDAHQHFWRYDSVEHAWMTEQMSEIKQDFLPLDLRPLMESTGFQGCVAVQARQSLEETRWLLELANENTFIKGTVGGVDLRAETLSDQLEQFAAHPKLVGVRHVLQDESDDKFMLGAAFQRGIAQLSAYGLTYDLLLFPKHLPVAVELVRKFPDQPFVLDHIAKPLIEAGILTPWQDNLRQLAMFPNVYCKLSGLVTEAAWKQWKPEDFKPYLDSVFDAFGSERLMIGSDWPVCTVSASYDATMRIVIEYVEQFPQSVQEAVLGENCARFYGLDVAEPIAV